MHDIPRTALPDSTLALLWDPYGFIARRCDRLGTDVFQTRILLRPTICMRGAEAARLFYDREKFDRQGAAPRRLLKTLFGEGGVQGLDGEDHRHRKALFLELLGPGRFESLKGIAQGWWRRYAERWAARGEERETVVLYDEVREILTRSVCDWAGVPLAEREVEHRTRQLAALYEGAGSVGPEHWRSRRARRRADRWARDLVEGVREGRLEAPEGSVLAVCATFRDREGRQLPPQVASVELLNVLRPTVAVSVFIAHAAAALLRHPECQQRIRGGDVAYLEWFVQEVRRLSPFFPAVAAHTRREFEWRGFRFPADHRALLDLHGTDLDPRLWEEPRAFRPERFADREVTPWNLVPQGGGDHAVHHRCPGEWISIELMKGAVAFLVTRLRFEVPEQDLTLQPHAIPPLPRSRVRLRRVRPVESPVSAPGTPRG